MPPAVSLFAATGNSVPCLRPLIGGSAAAGFPNPAEDFLEGELDLTAHCVRNPKATYYWRVTGDSMTGVGIYDGCLLVVDRSIPAIEGSIVVALFDGGWVCKRLRWRDGHTYLAAENPAYSDLIGIDFQVWGVATYVVRSLRRC